MTVANGDVWITGTATGSLPGEAAIGAQDGFVASLTWGLARSTTRSASPA